MHSERNLSHRLVRCSFLFIGSCREVNLRCVEETAFVQCRVWFVLPDGRLAPLQVLDSRHQKKQQKTAGMVCLLGHLTTNGREKKTLDVPFTSRCVCRQASACAPNGPNTCDLSAEIYERLGLSQSRFPSRFLFFYRHQTISGRFSLPA